MVLAYLTGAVDDGCLYAVQDVVVLRPGYSLVSGARALNPLMVGHVRSVQWFSTAWVSESSLEAHVREVLELSGRPYVGVVNGFVASPSCWSMGGSDVGLPSVQFVILCPEEYDYAVARPLRSTYP